ncbi:SEC-C metal-binding domain-containing protein [Chryseomicrobium sp. FSL W7-1435]|uniref:SEC-C metal-binding domain-containing protein n=1 Tax=Chryseomicrobium sp. FSL W7-1435 TaxID=2921704 RepID=UPI00315A00BE
MKQPNFHEMYKDHLSEKQWAPIDAELSLENALARVTKYELDKMRKFADIKGVSKLTKAKLAEVLVDQQQNLLEATMNVIDRERFEFLERAATHGFIEFAPVNVRIYSWFLKTGLLIPGSIDNKFVLVMPVDYRQPILEAKTNLNYQRMIKENDELMFVTKGLLEMFGVMRWSQLVEELTAIDSIPTHLQPSAVKTVITEYNHYDDYFEIKKEWVSDLLVDEPEDLLQAIDERPSIEPLAVTKKQMLELGKRGELEKTREFERFEKYLQKTFRVKKEEGEEILAQTILDIRNELTFHEVMQGIVKFFEFSTKAEAAEFAGYLTKLVNSTPRWILKGHAPNDLSDQSEPKTTTPPTKVTGRNEPCPCGSGKKYKKCCGK